MLNELNGDCHNAVRDEHDSAPLMEPRSVRRPGRSASSQDTVVKSATRALEIIELFGIFRGALSVSDIAGALNIPQSSSSILLKAMNKAGFIDRDRQTRKYLPSIRSAFLGNRMHDALFKHTSLLRTLDQLSLDTGCSVRLGVRNGIYVQYAHISWPELGGDRMRLRPGTSMPICHDALGVMLLVTEKDDAIRAIVRHANAVAEGEVPLVRPEDFLSHLDRCRKGGFSEAQNFDAPGECVLAVRLPTPFDVPAAIGLCIPAERLNEDRAALLDKLNAVAQPVWRLEAPDEVAVGRVQDAASSPAVLQERENLRCFTARRTANGFSHHQSPRSAALNVRSAKAAS